MQQNGKRPSPYKGLGVKLALMLAVPLALTGLFYVLLNAFQGRYSGINTECALVLGFGLGSIFHMMLAISGIFREPLWALRRRLRELRENLPLGLGFALRCYWEDLCYDGCVFVIEAAMMIACGAVWVRKLLWLLPKLI